MKIIDAEYLVSYVRSLQKHYAFAYGNKSGSLVYMCAVFDNQTVLKYLKFVNRLNLADDQYTEIIKQAKLVYIGLTTNDHRTINVSMIDDINAFKNGTGITKNNIFRPRISLANTNAAYFDEENTEEQINENDITENELSIGFHMITDVPYSFAKFMESFSIYYHKYLLGGAKVKNETNEYHSFF